jgi:hypothetical protein
LVYADTKETWFSPPAWYISNGDFEKEIHPAMAMQISMVWMVAYNICNMASVYCSFTEKQMQTGNVVEYQLFNENGFPPLSNQYKVPHTKPRYPHNALPPPLTRDLSLEHVSELWRNASSDIAAIYNDDDCVADSLQSRPCMFGWILGLGNDMKTTKELFQNFTTWNQWWDFMVDYKKCGWVPVNGLGSKMTMEFTNVTQPIRSVSVI